MKKYLSVFLVFILTLSVIIVFYLNGRSADEVNLTWSILIYFSLLTFSFHYGLVRTTRSRPQVFIRYYMAATTIKLLLHMGVIVIFSVTHRSLAVPFILTFMVMYFLFTGFELVVGRKGS